MKKVKIFLIFGLIAFITANKIYAQMLYDPFEIYSFNSFGNNLLFDNVYGENYQFISPLDNYLNFNTQFLIDKSLVFPSFQKEPSMFIYETVPNALDDVFNNTTFNISSNPSWLLSNQFLSINSIQFGFGTGGQDGFETGGGTDHEFGYNDPGYIPIKGGLLYLIGLCLIYIVVTKKRIFSVLGTS
jgi:hypothetical protein